MIRGTASQASDVGSIPIARSINHDSIVLSPLDQLNMATKLGVWSHDGPNRAGINWSQCASVGRRRQVDQR